MARDIEDIIQRVGQRFPTVNVWQLQVKHPGVDDDGIWFFTLADPEVPRQQQKDVQIESSDGMCPFIVEHSDMTSTADAITARSVADVVEAVCSYLASLQGRGS